ncbi:MAG: 50S ribosomal protein L11 methyltransferase [bacterium]|nr:50S ribosomal protein L11 methyltransferase [bacterium]
MKNSKTPFLEDNTQSLNWLAIALTARPDQEDMLYDMLIERRFSGWVVESDDPQLVWVCYLPCESGWEIRLASLKDALLPLGISVDVRSSVKDEDWANCWKQDYHVRPWGKTLVICPSWEEYQAKPGQHVILMDPGMAFGTGLHGSTSSCLLLLEEYLLENKVSQVLDVGTGSGILAIAAAKLGADHVLASDNDSVAVRTAQENVGRNGETEKIAVQEYDGVPEGEYDLVLANIVAAVHVALAEEYARAVAKGGRLIVSGIIDFRRNEVLGALHGQGFVLEKEIAEDEWVSLRMVRQ